MTGSAAPRFEASSQRLDRWLSHARVVRTRSGAAKLVEAGHVRVNGKRVISVAYALRPGDVVTLALDRSVRVMKVTGFSERRGSPEAGKALYQKVG